MASSQMSDERGRRTAPPHEVAACGYPPDAVHRFRFRFLDLWTELILILKHVLIHVSLLCTCTGYSYSVPAILSSLLGSDLWTEAEDGYRVVLIINPCARRITNLTRRWDKLMET